MGLIVVMAQIGSFVPAKRCVLTPMLQLHTRMGASDSISRRMSTFAAELCVVSEALASAHSHSLLLLDEVGRGTSTHDGTAIAHAILAHIASISGVMCLFTTHYPPVTELATSIASHVAVCHMATWQPEPSRSNALEVHSPITELPSRHLPVVPHVELLYSATPGIGSGSYGLCVAAVAGIPDQVLVCAALRSRELDERARRKKCEMSLLRLATHVVSAINRCRQVQANFGMPWLQANLRQLQVDTTETLALWGSLSAHLTERNAYHIRVK